MLFLMRPAAYTSGRSTKKIARLTYGTIVADQKSSEAGVGAMNRDAATHTAQQSHITQRPPEKSVRRSPLYVGSFPKMSRRQYCAE